MICSFYINKVPATEYDLAQLENRLKEGKEVVFAEIRSGAIHFRTENGEDYENRKRRARFSQQCEIRRLPSVR